MYFLRPQHTWNKQTNKYLCVCVSFSGLPKVGKLVEDAAFLEYFNYKATFPFSRAELTRTLRTGKRADKGLERPSPICTNAQNLDQFCSEYLFPVVLFPAQSIYSQPGCVMIAQFQFVTHK